MDVMEVLVEHGKQLAALREEHTSSGVHRVHEELFPDWVPAEVTLAAELLSIDDAVALLPMCLRDAVNRQ